MSQHLSNGVVSGFEQCPHVDIGISGTGRMGLDVAQQILDPRYGFSANMDLAAVNFSRPKDPLKNFGAPLLSDPVYGQKEDLVVGQFKVSERGGRLPEGSTFTDEGLDISLGPDGKVHEVWFSGNPRAREITWRDRREVATNGDASKIFAVVDATPIKINNSDLTQPAIEDGRHPVYHTLNGADFVVVTSPLRIKREGPYPAVRTLVRGVTDTQENIDEALQKRTLTYAASSCTTTALGNAGMLLSVAGYGDELVGFYADVSHANTESDSPLSALSTRFSTSGSSTELAPVFRDLGLSDDNIEVSVSRGPVNTGSLFTVRAFLKGRHHEDEVIARFEKAISDGGLGRSIKIEDRLGVAVDSTYIRRVPQNIVISRWGIAAMFNQPLDATVLTLKGAFDNEWGYANGVLDIVRRIAIRRMAQLGIREVQLA